MLNECTVFSTQGSSGFLWKRTSTLFTKREMGLRIRITSSGFLLPRTMMLIMAPTSRITTNPNTSQMGEMPTVSAKMAKPMIMMVANAESTVICINSAAEVALPAEMPRRRASSTTNVVPARFSEGITVLRKNVPNTSGKVFFGRMVSPTALNEKV